MPRFLLILWSWLLRAINVLFCFPAGKQKAKCADDSMSVVPSNHCSAVSAEDLSSPSEVSDLIADIDVSAAGEALFPSHVEGTISAIGLQSDSSIPPYQSDLLAEFKGLYYRRVLFATKKPYVDLLNKEENRNARPSDGTTRGVKHAVYQEIHEVNLNKLVLSQSKVPQESISDIRRDNKTWDEHLANRGRRKATKVAVLSDDPKVTAARVRDFVDYSRHKNDLARTAVESGQAVVRNKQYAGYSATNNPRTDYKSGALRPNFPFKQDLEYKPKILASNMFYPKSASLVGSKHFPAQLFEKFSRNSGKKLVLCIDIEKSSMIAGTDDNAGVQGEGILFDPKLDWRSINRHHFYATLDELVASHNVKGWMQSDEVLLHYDPGAVMAVEVQYPIQQDDAMLDLLMCILTINLEKKRQGYAEETCLHVVDIEEERIYSVCPSVIERMLADDTSFDTKDFSADAGNIISGINQEIKQNRAVKKSGYGHGVLHSLCDVCAQYAQASSSNKAASVDMSA